MKHLLWVIALGVLVPAYIFLTKFFGVNEGGKNDLVIGIVLLVISLVLLGIFYFKHFRAEASEEISITKF
jgi:hypothetical protein